MSDGFVFRFFEPGDNKRKSLVIFLPVKVPLDVVAKALKMDVTENLVPKNVYVMTLNNEWVKRDIFEADKSFVNEFDTFVGDINDHLLCLSANKSGELYYCDNNKVDVELAKEILHCGMIALFKKHSGIITSSHGYHFSKPSGDHCNKFIRASNLLVSSIEVSFLAISVLPHLRKDLKRIYVDTSSIAYFVSIAVQLVGGFDDGFPSIESFESYSVLNEPYDFVEDISSLLLISATTSGSLVKNMLSKTSFSRDQLVTLFHINLPNDQKGVFDISSAVGDGLVSKRASECDFCKRGAKLIRIAGDQFLPENPKHELLVVKKVGFEKTREEFFGQFAAEDVLEWNTAVSSKADSREHFFIDVESALSLTEITFSKHREKNIKRYVSRDLDVVVTFDDAGSQALKNEINTYLNSDKQLIKWLAPSEIDEKKVGGAGSVMVLVGAITSGRSLLAISRKLRSIDPSATIVYFVAFSKLSNKDSLAQLRKDLCQGGHELVVLSDCALPRIKEYTRTAWDWEYEMLAPYADEDPFGGVDQKLPEPLAVRLTLMDGRSSDPNSLFLPDPKGKQLGLRRTFAFWSDLGFSDARLKKVSQADVYWTIQCVLHDLRNKSENNGLATTYHTTLLSPVNFDRYNDGVIQACLLRAALPVELDYRVDLVFSRQMTDVILSMLNNWENAQGEASLEFLMALWTKRLQVADIHLEGIVYLKNDAMPEAILLLLDRLQEYLDTT